MNTSPNRDATDIQLFAFPTSPYAMKVGCYLAYLGQDYQCIGVSPITFKEVKFTGKRQVPALKIGEEWKLESTEIGLWLDEKYPGSTLLGDTDTERTQILEIDQWVSDQLIVAMFRVVVDWPSVGTGFRNGWKLSAAVNESSPLPGWVRFMWPVFLRKAKFIVAMLEPLDRSESLASSQQRLVNEFLERLDGGLFLGGRDKPSLADFSAFPIIVFPYRFGLRGDANWIENNDVMNWVSAVQQHLPENPFLVGDDRLPKKMPTPQ